MNSLETAFIHKPLITLLRESLKRNEHVTMCLKCIKRLEQLKPLNHEQEMFTNRLVARLGEGDLRDGSVRKSGGKRKVEA